MSTKLTRIILFMLYASAAAFAPVSAAVAKVEISKAPTKHMKCSDGVCKATAKEAVLNASDLQSLLASSSVTVETGNMTQDIDVSSGLTWVSAHGLALRAQGSIFISAEIAVEGSGGLKLFANQSGAGGLLSLGPKGKVTFWGTANKLVITNFKSESTYKLVNSIAALIQDVAANPNANYALANDYDASADGTYTQSPVNTLDGYFEGLGHTISNLSINANGNSNAALFDGVYVVNDLHLIKADVEGGAAAGIANFVETISGDSVSGKIVSSGNGATTGGIAANVSFQIVNCSSSAAVTAGPALYAGGIVGYDSATTYAIENSHFTGYVRGGTGYVGGIAGASSVPIDSSWSTGSITANASAEGVNVGGLVEFAGGSITDSYATGPVKGDGSVGGLAGTADEPVSNSYATGAVTDGDNGEAGGLVGYADLSKISNSYATGSVSGGDGTAAGGLVGLLYQSSIDLSFATGSVTSGLTDAAAGGLVGVMQRNGSIDQSYAIGSAKAGSNSYAGGLVGIELEFDGEIPTIENAYATGSATGGAGSDVGGLVGEMVANDTHPPVVETSYSTGTVKGGTSGVVGGLVGYALYDSGSKNLSDNYWDTTTSGITDLSDGAGNIKNIPGITGLTTTQLQSGLPPGFSSKVWAEAPGIEDGLPYLVALPPQTHSAIRSANSRIPAKR